VTGSPLPERVHFSPSPLKLPTCACQPRPALACDFQKAIDSLVGVKNSRAMEGPKWLWLRRSMKPTGAGKSKSPS